METMEISFFKNEFKTNFVLMFEMLYLMVSASFDAIHWVFLAKRKFYP